MTQANFNPIKAYFVTSKSKDASFIIFHYSPEEAIQLLRDKGGIAGAIALKVPDVTVNVYVTEPCIVF